MCSLALDWDGPATVRAKILSQKFASQSTFRTKTDVGLAASTSTVVLLDVLYIKR